MKGPPNTCLKDRYTLIEQSDLNTLIEQSQYSSEEQCSKLILGQGPHFALGPLISLGGPEHHDTLLVTILLLS